MAKLYFRYGTMTSAKTLNLLAVRHNYDSQGKRVMVIKPRIDTRFGADIVRSRAGLEHKADVLVDRDTKLDFAKFEGCSCLLVDEGQFLSEPVVEQLRELTRVLAIPVIVYGLRTDFLGRLFDGSRRLLELCDSIEEVKTTCHFCNRKAVFNLRHDEIGNAVAEGPALLLGADLHYSPACYPCYRERMERAQCNKKA